MNGGAAKNLNASTRQELVETGTAGNSPLRLTLIDNLFFADGSEGAGFSLPLYASQGTNHSIILNSTAFGENIRTFSSAQSVVPGDFQLGATFTKSIPYSDGGTSATVTFTIVSVENVTVPYGTYDTFKVNASTNYGNGYSRNGTYWYVPSLGSYIKATETVVTPGVTDNVTAELTAIGTP